MNISMSGLDHNTAAIDIREKFFIQASNVGNLAKQIKAENGLLGCVIISTCNRTEIYISSPYEAEPSVFLQKALGFMPSEYSSYFITRKNDEALLHLMETAAGLHSQIFGDDQIVSQVKTALAAAREAKAADSFLETLFRTAITAAKQIKSEVRLGVLGPSVALSAVESIEKYFGSLAGLSALVIGNGEMGKIASALLVERKANVTVTIREYKYKPVAVVNHCQTIMYSERYSYLSNFDMVISATTSPHHTITLQEMQKLSSYPRYFMDLALPRDIDPKISALGINLSNVDSLKCPITKTGLLEAQAIISKHRQKFYDWYKYKSNLNEVII